MKSGLDHHSHQFLHKKLARVWDPHLANVLTALARPAEVLLLLDVRLTEETTRRANMHSVAVTDIEEALFQETT